MLKIVEAGILTTIQDAGRWGYQTYGVPVSGAMDWFAFAVANRLVSNAPNSAALEIRSSITLETNERCVIALTGAAAELWIDRRVMPTWTSVFVRAGSFVEIKSRGGWNYLAIHGGVDVPRVLGSRSTYARAGLGNVLQTGDEVSVGESLIDVVSLAGKIVSDSVRAFSSRHSFIRLVLGPHHDWFTSGAIETLTSTEYSLTGVADRMGYRLIGAKLERARNEELISCGVPLGAIQIPADGQPIVLMADHQTTGGYPIIATVIRADLPMLAQRAPDESVSFQIVDVEQAQAAWREMLQLITRI